MGERDGEMHVKQRGFPHVRVPWMFFAASSFSLFPSLSLYISHSFFSLSLSFFLSSLSPFLPLSFPPFLHSSLPLSFPLFLHSSPPLSFPLFLHSSLSLSLSLSLLSD